MWQKIKNYYHLVQATCASVLYGFPSRKLKVIGVTGTDGKTTTTSLIYHILQSNGKKVSMISTVFAKIGGKVYDTGFHTTTPSPFTIQKFLKQAVENGDEYFILETTSHALDQYRVFGVNYWIGVITNITHEHLLYHQTYENYVYAKSRLLNMSKIGVVNRDDMSHEYIMKCLEGELSGENRKILTYGLKNKSDFQMDIAQKIGKILPEFNKYNYLAAYTVAKQCEILDDEIYRAMQSFQLPPGRMETIYDTNFTVIIDFAHTPNAILEALRAIRTEYQNRRIIHIFGAASERDDSKRPLMGEASGESADLVIITEEDYRKEDPLKIAKEIAVGLVKKSFTFVEEAEFGTRNKTYTIQNDRGKAVTKALQIIKPNDVLVLTGKGHEMSLNRKGKEYPWNDAKTVRENLNKYHSH